MKLVNTTPVPADAYVVKGMRNEYRGLLVGAMGTFTVSETGDVALDQESPLPVRRVDDALPLGLLPPALVPKLDAGFEVMVLGRAHSPTGEPVREVPVRLEVGSEVRRLVISGDRIWEGRGPHARIGPAEPFTAMALDWTRAFGGTAEVGIDEGAAVDVADGRNAAGRGFDHFAQAKSLAGAFGCPPGYPTCPDTRPLPNIEDPDNRVSAWDDAPLPACWAPLPAANGLLAERASRYFGEDVMAGESEEELEPEELADAPIAHERAHPDWVIETPPERALVRLTGMCPGGAEMVFRLPRARVRAEICEGALDGLEAELHPRALILLPEERRFALVFRGAKLLAYVPDERRTVRIRLERGWSPAPPDDDGTWDDDDATAVAGGRAADDETTVVAGKGGTDDATVVVAKDERDDATVVAGTDDDDTTIVGRPSAKPEEES